jgi:hypothetical protein
MSSVNIIIDTDNDSDEGDTFAISTANYLMNRGEANILAIVTDTASANSTAAAQAICTWYGNASVPVGSCQSGGFVTQTTACDAVYAAFPSALKSSGNHPVDAVKLLRMILSRQPNNSVVYVGIGLYRTLYNLYNSPADNFSSLTGAQLIAQKIKFFSIMSGDYGVTYPASEYNNITDATATQVINNLTSMPIYWIGYTFGNSVITVLNQSLTNTPAYIAANSRSFDGYERASWDTLPVLFAVRGLSYNGETYFALNGPGTNTVNTSALNTFTTGSGSQYYLTAGESTTTLGNDLSTMVNASVQTYVGGQDRRVFQAGDIPLRPIQTGDISLHK